jgi:nitroreductase
MRDIMVDYEVIEQALKLACRAPSLHNSQPWRWVLDDNAVQLFEDKDRVLYATDHSGREALLGCGAALDHFRVAMAAAGWIANVDRFPNPNNPLLLASIDFTPIGFVAEGHRRRAQAILVRRTDRLPFAEPPDWKQTEARLASAVVVEGVRLDVIPDEFRTELAEASQFSELSRLYDSSYHSELSRWTNPYDTKQGVPPSALVSAEESERVDVGRTFPVTATSDRRVGFGQDHSKVVVLSTYNNDRLAVLQCGEMLSAILLEATMAGLATCTLTHIIEQHAGTNVVASLIDQTTTPQVLVRVGQASEVEKPPPPTPRRPLDEVFHVRSKDH